MAVPNPEHLLEQAEELLRLDHTGAPRQADLRRAISTAYYAIFHATLTAVADHFADRTRRASGLYAVVYRSVDHARLRKLCEEAARQSLSSKYAPYAPQNVFGDDIKIFADAFINLQQMRHKADYDPRFTASRSGAVLAIDSARDAVRRFQAASEDERRTFLTFLLFEPR